MTNILGLNIGHDPSAAILRADGEVLAAVHEARISRVKKERRFPRNAIAAALATSNTTAEEVGVVAYSSYAADNVTLFRDKFLCGRGSQAATVEQLFRDELISLGLGDSQVVRIGHHYSHACAAMYASRNPETLIITSDGYGDDLSLTVRLSSAGMVPPDPQFSAPIDASLGLVYQYVTGGLGYSMLSEEWKVLGLEPFGSPEEASGLFSRWAPREFGVSRWDVEGLEPWNLAETPLAQGSMTERCSALRRYMELNVERYDRRDVASAVQLFIERRLLGALSNYAKLGVHSVSLGGGTFLNVKLNRLISELSWVHELTAFPAAGDGGNAVGAGLGYIYSGGMSARAQGIQDVYWGQRPIDSASPLARRLKELPRLPDTEQIAAISTAVANGGIVAIVRGRSEFGPRALLNRSLICRPDMSRLTRTLTRSLQRDEVMPYGCSMLEGEIGYALRDSATFNQCLRFMIGASKVSAEFAERFRPVCHPVRGGGWTTRPHLVSEAEPWRGQLLKAIGRKTGAAVVLNTSFNVHGEPIVETAEDALRTFHRMAVAGSTLLLEDRLISVDVAERLVGRPSEIRKPVSSERPRRRREACVCAVVANSRPGIEGVRIELEALGLKVLAERAISAKSLAQVSGRCIDDLVGPEAISVTVLLVVGSESVGVVDRWVARREEDRGPYAMTAGCDMQNCYAIRKFFGPELSHGYGAFADLSVMTGGEVVDDALRSLSRTSSLALIGLIIRRDEFQRYTTAGIEAEFSNGIPTVFGTCVPVPAPLNGRMYLYAPEGFRSLRNLARRADSAIRKADFAACREDGFVLAYSPPVGRSSATSVRVESAVEWGVDCLVTVRPGLPFWAASMLEDLASKFGLAAVGGSECMASERQRRPLGVRSSGLARFINRFPGMEL